MKILVVYSKFSKNFRKSTFDHLYSFYNYVPNIEFHYCDILTRAPFYLRFVNYDAVIVHFTFFAQRWTRFIWDMILRNNRWLQKAAKIKVAIPQDEYVYTNDLCRFFRDFGIETVFTCAHPVDYHILYPKDKTGLRHYFTTYAGFVDEKTLEKSTYQFDGLREIDIGYRARNLPYWLGEFGQLKKRLADVFLGLKDKTSLNLDISTDYKNVFYGEQWFGFLRRCRTMLGCLGGASLHDPEGVFRYKTEKYLKEHPDASFEEVKKACFPRSDYTLNLFALSPRHFECAMTKTCQVLVEGNYYGVLEAGKHYIEIKKDFSNLEEVLKKVADKELCERLAEQAYQDLVQSGKYTYRTFAQRVVDHIDQLKEDDPFSKTGSPWNHWCFCVVGKLLDIRHAYPWLYRLRYKLWCFFNRMYRGVQRRFYRYVLKEEWDETKPAQEYSR